MTYDDEDGRDEGSNIRGCESAVELVDLANCFGQDDDAFAELFL
jgi:hypothetical protein